MFCYLWRRKTEQNCNFKYMLQSGYSPLEWKQDRDFSIAKFRLAASPRREKSMANILLIDDNPELRDILRKHLETHGHRVTAARNGDEGLALLAGSGFDIVLTDILMPQRDGVEVLREAKRRWPDLPVIAISGGGWIGATELLGMAERLGADKVLQKPVRRDDLIAAVDAALQANLRRQA
jgi:CheY-like chemotaxis protein